MENDILKYVIEDALILIPVLYIIGVFLKRIPHVPDWVIPWLVLIVGAISGYFIVGEVFSGIIQGILASGATVLANQLFKQTIKRD